MFGAMAKSGGRHQSAAKMVAAIFLRGWCRQTLLPPSAEIVGDGGWESQVEQMILVAKEAGRWCWVIVDHFEWSVSLPIKAIIVINSNYGN